MTTSQSAQVPPRVYVTTDPNAEVKAIAQTPEAFTIITTGDTAYRTNSDSLHVSYDGIVFNTVLSSLRTDRGYSFAGTVTHPGLNIDSVSIELSDGVVTYNGVTYALDENATIGEIITKPIMRIVELVETCHGFYVTTLNRLTGKPHNFLNGQPLVILGGFRAREGNIVAEAHYDGHVYQVTGDHMDTSRQTATFDGCTATILDPKDYIVIVADDLSTVTVTRK